MAINKTIWFKIVVALAAIIVIIFLHSINALQPIEGVVTMVLKPMQTPLHKFSLTISDSELLKTKQELLDEKNSVDEKNKQLIADNSELKTQLQEIEELSEQVGYLDTEKFDYQPAKIINKLSASNAQVVIINQGKNRNIEEGMAVVAEQGILIGKIIEVESNTSKVLLITSNLSKVAAEVQTDAATPGLVVGEHGLSLKMELIPKQDQIDSRNIVITSSTEEQIPKGLIIGEIDFIEEQPGDLFKTATIIPLLDYSRLNIVSVIIP